MPDSLPLLGGLDDLVVVVLAVDLFLDGVPPELLQEKLDDLGIDRVAFDRDIAQIRRLTPGPVRRTIRRIPALIAGAGRAIERSGVAPRVRAWITREGPSHLKVILTNDVDKLGKSGEMKQVSDGYATNFLIPQGVAVPAAGGAYRAWQHDIANREDKRKKEREEAEIAATRIASTTLTMGVKVGEGGKLYGSITSKDIADALARRGIEVDRHKIDLEEPLKIARHVQGRDQGLHGDDPRSHDRGGAQGLTDRCRPTRRRRDTRRAPLAPPSRLGRTPFSRDDSCRAWVDAVAFAVVCASSCSTRSWPSSCSRARPWALVPRDLEPLGRAALLRGGCSTATARRPTPPGSSSSRCCRP